MNIYLVGFMGTGKTAVAKRLAQLLDLEFLEMDELIEKRENKTINRIFQEDGETHFRKVEKEVAYDVSSKDNLVVSCGGGVVLDEDNLRNLKKSGIVICLEAKPDVIYQRTQGRKHRPLLNVENPKERIKELLKQREPYYKKADYNIETSNLSIEEVVKEVRGIIKDKING